MKQEFAGPDGWTEWIFPKRKGYKMACCDCGLTHEMDFKLAKFGNGYKIYFRVKRDESLTMRLRGKMAKATYGKREIEK